MSKIINAILLFVAGTALSFITNDFIVTTVGCFLVGLVLNRRRERGSARPVILKTISELPRSIEYPTGVSLSVRCSSCGAVASQYTKYCVKCGSEMRAPQIAAEEVKKTAMFCIQCGAKLEIDSEFCKHCGTKVVA